MSSRHRRVTDLERSRRSGQDIRVLWVDSGSGIVYWTDRDGDHKMTQTEYARLYPDKPGDIVIEWEEGSDTV